MGGHDAVQVCLSGHVITDSYHEAPEFRESFCAKCGQPTIYKCQSCGSEIPGRYKESLSAYVMKTPPAYCRECGKSHPWLATKILAAQAMADELEDLSASDREKLKQNIELIAADSPMTEVAVTRIKKLMTQLPADAGAAMRRLLIDVAAKTAAEMLKGK